MKRRYRLSTGELRTYQYPTRGKKRKVWLTEAQVQAMLDNAKAHSKRDYLLMLLLRWSLRVGEVVGHRKLPGIQLEDIRDDSILIHGKGGKPRTQPIPIEVIALLRSYLVDANVKGKVFAMSERSAERMIKDYARKAGVAEGDWQLITPHRLRAFFANNARWAKNMDSLIIRDLMGHSSVRHTEIYIGVAPPDYLAAAVKKLAEQNPS